MKGRAAPPHPGIYRVPPRGFVSDLFVKVKQCSSCSICRQIAIKLLCKTGFKLYSAPVFPSEISVFRTCEKVCQFNLLEEISAVPALKIYRV